MTKDASDPVDSAATTPLPMNLLAFALICLIPPLVQTIRTRDCVRPVLHPVGAATTTGLNSHAIALVFLMPSLVQTIQTHHCARNVLHPVGSAATTGLPTNSHAIAPIFLMPSLVRTIQTHHCVRHVLHPVGGAPIIRLYSHACVGVCFIHPPVQKMQPRVRILINSIPYITHINCFQWGITLQFY